MEMTLYHVDDKDLTYTVFPILINFLLYMQIILSTVLSVSAKGLFSNSYKVSFDKTFEQGEVRAKLTDKDKYYQKHFTAIMTTYWQI